MERVLIVGASGFVGSEIITSFSKDSNYITYGTYLNNPKNDLFFMDATSVDSVKDVFEKTVPDIVIIVASLANVDYCENNREKTWDMNVVGIKNIVNACKANNCRIIYISTDYVFDGEDGPYSETDLTNPINYYGHTKLKAEGEVIAGSLEHTIIRTTVVYGWALESKNFIMQLIRNLSQGKTMRVPLDQIGNPTYAPNLAEMTKEVVDKNINGVINLAGSEIYNRYSFAQKATEHFGLDSSLLIPLETKYLGQDARRPLNGGLIVEKAIKLLENKPAGIDQGLSEIAKFLIKEKKLIE